MTSLGSLLWLMQAYQPTMKPSLRAANGRCHAISQERTPAIPRSEIVSALYGELWRSRRISKTHTGHSNERESALHTPNCGGRTVSHKHLPGASLSKIASRQHVEARLYLKDAPQAYHAAGDSEFRTANCRGQSRHITQRHSQRFKRQSVEIRQYLASDFARRTVEVRPCLKDRYLAYHAERQSALCTENLGGHTVSQGPIPRCEMVRASHREQLRSHRIPRHQVCCTKKFSEIGMANRSGSFSKTRTGSTMQNQRFARQPVRVTRYLKGTYWAARRSALCTANHGSQTVPQGLLRNSHPPGYMMQGPGPNSTTPAPAPAPESHRSGLLLVDSASVPWVHCCSTSRSQTDPS